MEKRNELTGLCSKKTCYRAHLYICIGLGHQKFSLVQQYATWESDYVWSVI